MTVITRVAAGASVPSAQGNAVVQSPLFETNVSPAGVGSETTTSRASDGPLLTTVTVYESGAPATALAGPAFTTATSALARSVVCSGSLLLPGMGSGWVPETVATSSMTPGVGGVEIVTPRATLLPGAIVPTSHVTTAPDAEHPALPVTKAVPGGSVSVTVTLVAVAGPRFVTASV